jgi:hypothetical protein
MKLGISKKSKRIIITVIFVVVSVSIYILVSTIFINEMNYRIRAYAITNYAKNIIDWKVSNVALVKLEKEPCNTPRILSARIGRYLLFFNGGYAVKVEMHTNMDDLLGPEILYFNPFTKQCIGGVLRR